MCRNAVGPICWLSLMAFWLRNDRLSVVSSCKCSICSCTGIVFLRCETFKYGQCCPAMKLICWYSRRVVSWSETLKFVKCSPEIGLIWWCSGIAFSYTKLHETTRNVQCSLERPRFAYTRESCFEAWKCSHMSCSALLCGRFADSEKSCWQASKRSNMG